MKTQLLNLFKNPVGAGLVALHWTIALTTLFYIPVDNFGRVPESGKIAMAVFFLLGILDIPAIVLVALLFSPFYLLGTRVDFIGLPFFLVAFVVISFQWLLIGRVIDNFFRRTETENEILRINENTTADNLDSLNKTELKNHS